MKPIHLHNWMGGTVVALALSMLAASCTDDDMSRPAAPADGIAFVPTIDSRGWNAGDSARTRTAVSATHHRVTELRNTQGGKSLYLHTFETDCIATPDTSDTARIATRGAVVTSDNFAKQYGGFGVLAYAYQDQWNDMQDPNYIDNVKATTSGGTYGFNPSYFWPGKAYKMAFFAYAPYDKDGTIFQEKIGEPTLKYTVPTGITEQKDLLAYWEKDVLGDKKETIGLRFKHLCTAVKFKVGSGLENAITSISIKNVCGSGTYSVADEKWTTTGEADGTYTLTIDSDNTPKGTELTEGENTFMMIPQMLPEGAEIEVTFMENGQEQTLMASIGGSRNEWKKGHTMIYTISRTEVIEEIHFIVDAATKEVDYQGGDLSFMVTSYSKKTENGIVTTTPVSWKVTGYKEGEGSEWSTTAPTWLTLVADQGTGSSTGEEKKMSIMTQTSYTANPQNDALDAAAEITDRYDLSTRGGTTLMNTANSYIVNAPGMYTLPLVYGNAIVNGSTNESAYKTKNTGEGILQTFINHLGRGITSPYIYENTDADGNKLSAQKAELLWQDVENLVTNVQLSADGESLEFKVDKSTIKQGNAVIAIRDSEGNIMWSWHIWVTDYNPYEDEDDFFSRYLGFCYNESTIYDPRTVTLRFEQEGTDKQVELTITQTEYRIEDGNCPFYQFGRKDPMLPATTSTDKAVNKTWYDAQGNSSTTIEKIGGNYDRGDDVIIYCMKNPDKFCGALYMDLTYYNIWATENRKGESESKKSSVKTVYDPSPAGYQVSAYGLLKSELSGKSPFKSGYRQNYTGLTSLSGAGKHYYVYSSLAGEITDDDVSGTKAYSYVVSSNSFFKEIDRGNAVSVLPVKEDNGN